MTPVRILIVDDHADMRRALRRLLTLEDWQVCAEAADGLEAVQAAREHTPDVIIMDVSMPHMSGLQAAARILEESPTAAIMLITAFDLSETDVREMGVRGSLSKLGLHRLPDGVRAILRGEEFHVMTAGPDRAG